MRSGSTPKCHGSATLIETNDHSDAVILMLKNFSVADPDPGFGAFLTPGSGMGESQHPDPGSRINNPDHIF